LVVKPEREIVIKQPSGAKEKENRVKIGRGEGHELGRRGSLAILNN
jgi:hypothetical protein